MGWIYTVKYYPTIKNKITLSGKWGELEIAMLIKQHEPVFSQLYGIYKKKRKNECRSVFGKRKMRKRGRK